MKERRKRAISKDLAALAELLATWRRSKSSPRERVPEKLWRRAVVLARRHGVSAVVHHLGLSHVDLKGRVAGKALGRGATHAASSKRVPRVIKLAPVIVSSPATAAHEAVIEIEGGGCRLRVISAQLQEVVRAFVEACR